MNRLDLIFIVMAFILFAGCTTQPQSSSNEALQLFSPDGGGFSIALRGTPTYETQTFDTTLGQVVSNVYTLERSKTEVYLVSYTDYPDEVLKADPQTVLDGVRDGAVSNVHGKLFSENRITLNGYPGREFTVVIGTQYIHARAYLVGKRLYTVMASAPGYSYSEVLESFKLI